MTLPVEGVMLEPPALSTLVIDRLATLSVSVAKAALPTGGVTVAVLVNDPCLAGSIVAVTVYVIELPAGRLTPDWLMLPVPVVAKPLAPPVCVAVQLSPDHAPGAGSEIVAPVRLPLPVLLTTIV